MEQVVTVVKGDILDYPTVEGCAKGTDAVVHLAGITSVPFSIQNPSITHKVNVDGTLNLLNAAVKNGTRNFIFASSCAVYGEAQLIPTPEEHPNHPLSPYAASKVDASELCEGFHTKYGLNTTCLRIFNVYGEGQPAGSYSGVISQFRSKILRSEAPVIYGDGLQTRDFIHVDDVVSTIGKLVGDGNINGSYNVGTGLKTTIESLQRLVSELMTGEATNPTFEQTRDGEIRHSQADIRKLHRKIGFSPEIELEEGLLRMFASIVP